MFCTHLRARIVFPFPSPPLLPPDARKKYMTLAKKDGEKDVETRYVLPNLVSVVFMCVCVGDENRSHGGSAAACFITSHFPPLPFLQTVC